jgi:hypothetical protein
MGGGHFIGWLILPLWKFFFGVSRFWGMIEKPKVFSHRFFNNSCEFVKSVARVLGFSAKSGRAGILNVEG